MSDDEHIRRVVVDEMENFIRRNGWSDAVVQQALLDVARNHVWKRGLWIRLKVITLIAAGIGAVGSTFAMIAAFFGLELRR